MVTLEDNHEKRYSLWNVKYRRKVLENVVMGIVVTLQLIVGGKQLDNRNKKLEKRY
jgi:hypothetical protein